MTNQYSYELSLNILKALGGDMTVQYENTDQIWAAIDGIYAASGDGLDLQALVLNITENGTYDYNITDEIDAYVPVNISVNVPQKYTDEQVEDLKDTAREEGYTSGYTEGETTGYQSGYTEGQTAGYTTGYDKGVADGYVQGESEGYTDGYAEGLEDGAEDQKALLEDITVTENGVYEKEDGYKKVTVEVPMPEIPTFETESLTKTLKTNGTYNYTPTTDGFSDVNITVDVPTGGDTGKPKIYNGFQFTGGDIAKVDFSEYDWSGVYDTDYFFEKCSHSTGDWSNFFENYNGKILSVYSMFRDCSTLTSVPQLDTSNMVNTSYMFYNCNNLTTIPMYNTSNVNDMSYMFYNCKSLISVPQFDTSKVSNVSSMFDGCSSLMSVPQLDTSNVTNMRYMFNYCNKLTSIPQLDTSNVTDMNKTFSSCSSLTSIPQLDTSNVTNMTDIFSSCSSLTSIPQLDTSNVTSMGYMFSGCSSLTSIPQLDTSNVTAMGYMFQNCFSLTSIPKLYCGKISSGSNINIFGYSNTNNLTDLGGFEDLGKVSGFNKPSPFLKNCPNITKESVMNVINNLYDRKSAGYSVVVLPFHTNSLALLSDEEKAIATNKGWTLATS